MKLQIVGKLSQVGEVQIKENYKFQEIQVSVIEYDRESGDPLPAEIYPALIFNKNIDKLSAKDFAGKMVHTTCWTRSIAKEHDGRTFYNLVLNCSDIKEV